MKDNTAGEAVFQPKPLGLICGAGEFPAAVALAASRAGYEVFCIKITPDPTPGIERYKHIEARFGEVGKMLKALRSRGIADLCLIGSVQRPHVMDLRPDWGAVRHIPNLIQLFQGGDDQLLSGILRFVEEQGFTVHGAHEIAPSLLAGEGALTECVPSDSHRNDIRKGFALLDALSSFDVGQAAVICEGQVIAIEGIEGTDRMLERVAVLLKRKDFRRGVLVKAPKRMQDQRIDMPAVGPKTLQNLANAGLAGLCVRAGQVMVLQQDEMAQIARQHGVFVWGQGNDSA